MKLLGVSRIFPKKSRTVAEGHYAALLDITVNSISAGVGRFTDQGLTLLGASEHPLSMGVRSRSKIVDRAKLVNEIDNTLAEAAMQADMRPQHALFSFSGELVHGVTTIVRLKRESPSDAINRDELRHIIQRVQGSAYGEAKSRLETEFGPSMQWELVNMALPWIRIDNKLQKDLIGQKGKVVEFEVYNAFAPTQQLELFSSVADELALEVLMVTTSAYAMVRALIESDDSRNQSGILVDVGGPMTEVSVFHEGGMVGMHSFSIGFDAVTERIADVFNMEWIEAQKTQKQYIDGELDVYRANKVREVARAVCEHWVVGVETSLGLFEHVDYFPQTFHLMSHLPLLPEYRAALSANDWVKSLAFSENPNVHEALSLSLAQVIDQTGKLAGPNYLGIGALANLAVGLEKEDAVLQGILQEVAESA